eukprot:g14742.t1
MRSVLVLTAIATLAFAAADDGVPTSAWSNVRKQYLVYIERSKKKHATAKLETDELKKERVLLEQKIERLQTQLDQCGEAELEKILQDCVKRCKTRETDLVASLRSLREGLAGSRRENDELWAKLTDASNALEEQRQRSETIPHYRRWELPVGGVHTVPLNYPQVTVKEWDKAVLVDVCAGRSLVEASGRDSLLESGFRGAEVRPLAAARDVEGSNALPRPETEEAVVDVEDKAMVAGKDYFVPRAVQLAAPDGTAPVPEPADAGLARAPPTALVPYGRAPGRQLSVPVFVDTLTKTLPYKRRVGRERAFLQLCRGNLFLSHFPHVHRQLMLIMRHKNVEPAATSRAPVFTSADAVKTLLAFGTLSRKKQRSELLCFDAEMFLGLFQRLDVQTMPGVAFLPVLGTAVKVLTTGREVLAAGGSSSRGAGGACSGTRATATAGSLFSCGGSRTAAPSEAEMNIKHKRPPPEQCLVLGGTPAPSSSRQKTSASRGNTHLLPQLTSLVFEKIALFCKRFANDEDVLLNGDPHRITEIASGLAGLTSAGTSSTNGGAAVFNIHPRKSQREGEPPPLPFKAANFPCIIPMLKTIGEYSVIRSLQLSEDDFARLARSFAKLEYAPREFFCGKTGALLSKNGFDLKRRLPELKLWNLVDIGEAIATLFVQPGRGRGASGRWGPVVLYGSWAAGEGGGADRRAGRGRKRPKGSYPPALFRKRHSDLPTRIAQEVRKYRHELKGAYPARLLRFLAHCQTGNKSLIQICVRSIPRKIHTMKPNLTLDLLKACCALNMRKSNVYHKITGERIFRMLCFHLSLRKNFASLSTERLCEGVNALANLAGYEDHAFFSKVEERILAEFQWELDGDFHDLVDHWATSSRTRNNSKAGVEVVLQARVQRLVQTATDFLQCGYYFNAGKFLSNLAGKYREAPEWDSETVQDLVRGSREGRYGCFNAGSPDQTSPATTTFPLLRLIKQHGRVEEWKSGAMLQLPRLLLSEENYFGDAEAVENRKMLARISEAMAARGRGQRVLPLPPGRTTSKSAAPTSSSGSSRVSQNKKPPRHRSGTAGAGRSSPLALLPHRNVKVFWSLLGAALRLRWRCPVLFAEGGGTTSSSFSLHAFVRSHRNTLGLPDVLFLLEVLGELKAPGVGPFGAAKNSNSKQMESTLFLLATKLAEEAHLLRSADLVDALWWGRICFGGGCSSSSSSSFPDYSTLLYRRVSSSLTSGDQVIAPKSIHRLQVLQQELRLSALSLTLDEPPFAPEKSEFCAAVAKAFPGNAVAGQSLFSAATWRRADPTYAAFNFLDGGVGGGTSSEEQDASSAKPTAAKISLYPYMVRGLRPEVEEVPGEQHGEGLDQAEERQWTYAACRELLVRGETGEGVAQVVKDLQPRGVVLLDEWRTWKTGGETEINVRDQELFDFKTGTRLLQEHLFALMGLQVRTVPVVREANGASRGEQVVGMNGKGVGTAAARPKGV